MTLPVEFYCKEKKTSKKDRENAVCSIVYCSERDDNSYFLTNVKNKLRYVFLFAIPKSKYYEYYTRDTAGNDGDSFSIFRD